LLKYAPLAAEHSARRAERFSWHAGFPIADHPGAVAASTCASRRDLFLYERVLDSPRKRLHWREDWFCMIRLATVVLFCSISLNSSGQGFIIFNNIGAGLDAPV